MHGIIFRQVNIRVHIFSLILWFILFGGLGRTASGQLVINEFAASNTGHIVDPDYNDDADWIELYNAGDSPVRISGYYLTDNLNNPDKWQISRNITISAGEYLLIWADDYDTGLHTSFKLAAEGEEIGLFTPDLAVVDTIRFSTQKADVSFGRNPANLNQWGYFRQPTPNAPNSTAFYVDFVKSIPDFTPWGGLYNAQLAVELFTDMGGTIRYTLNGSEPTINSTPYTSAIPVNDNLVIRARIFKPDMIPGPITTHSYFVNEGSEEVTLPIISIATDPGNFWDQDTGIYVQNFKPDWEVPVNIEMFENNGSDRAAFNEPAGIKINGLYSWKLPQKMLGVYFRSQYGSGSLDYPLFLNSYRSSFKTFALRASGSDWSYTLFRDILGQGATRYNMQLDISAFRPCIVYVNGEYLGIHNIREKIETDYIEENHKLEAGTFDIVENEDYAEAGDLREYNELLGLLEEDLSIQANYDAVAEKIDIENFTDLVITEMAVGNTSINHNVMAWKPKGTGKWRWIVMDLDRGFFNPSSNLINFYLGQDVFPFHKLFDNEKYREYFGKRLADHLYTTYNPTRMEELVDEHQQEIDEEIPRHIDRWLGTTSSYGDAMPSVDYWYEEVCNLKTFVRSRPIALLTDLDSYGFDGTYNLTLAVIPSDAGYITINGLNVPEPVYSGPYLRNVPTQLVAEEKAGYQFQGWKNSTEKVIVSKGSVWKYLDDGTDQGTSWYDTNFNDDTWSSGPAQLGYGDGDESTVISYGGNSQNKYITSYFRSDFNLSQTDMEASHFMINLLKDDGAVVYVNGMEVVRDNMSCGEINYHTTAISSVGGESELAYTSFLVESDLFNQGNNVIAVEVHQNAGNSSDLSFDLELVAYLNDGGGFVSTSKNYTVTLTDDIHLTAVYGSTGECIVSEIITENTTLYKGCSPYLVQENVTIMPDVVLTIEPGVEIRMPENGNIFVHGAIEALGSDEERILFTLNPKYNGTSWGAVNFENTTDTSHLSYITIQKASRGPIPLWIGAISAFYADLNLDHVIIDEVFDNPISARYSNVTLMNSYLHSDVTGDLINVKYGKARIENCELVGNSNFDADGVDYDDVENGLIKNCEIMNCVGFNSDAIDIGEKATNVIIDSVFICDVFDKGISVGQRSSVIVKNSIIVNCNTAVGVKDSSKVVIDHCVFYSDAWPIRCYEKNPGRAGGNAIVRNSILSNSSESSYSADSQSSLEILYSLSDNDPLPYSEFNLFENPLFSNPTHFDYQLKTGSPCILAGNDKGKQTDMGITLQNIDREPDLMILMIFINSLNQLKPEFIALYNPSSQTVDISNYSISKGVTVTIPEGTYLAPYDTLYLTCDAVAYDWNNYSKQIFQWEDGKLSNDGEAIQLDDNYGIPVDFVRYENNSLWPSRAFTDGEVLLLLSPDLDNHFAESWTTIPFVEIPGKPSKPLENTLTIFPNPSRDWITLIAPMHANGVAKIYSLMGDWLDTIVLDDTGYAEINLSIYRQNMIFIQVGDRVKKIVWIK